MKIQLLKEHLKRCYELKQPVMIFGPPGGGKSEIVKNFCENEKLGLIDIRLAYIDQTEFKGFPKIGEDSFYWVPPNYLPKEPKSKGILFFDEVTSALPTMQALLYQLTLDRRIGDYCLPDGWSVVMAGNRTSDRGISFNMPSPLRNRISTVQLETTPEEWIQWGLENEVAPEITSYIGFRPHSLQEEIPVDGAFATPRSWTLLSQFITKKQWKQLIKANSLNVIDIIGSFVGKSKAVDLAAFLKCYKNLPKVEDILKEPAKADLPGEASGQHAICHSLINRSKKEPSACEASAAYLNRISGEFVVLFLHSLMKDLKTNPVFTKTVTLYGNLIL